MKTRSVEVDVIITLNPILSQETTRKIVLSELTAQTLRLLLCVLHKRICTFWHLSWFHFSQTKQKKIKRVTLAWLKNQTKLKHDETNKHRLNNRLVQKKNRSALCSDWPTRGM